MVDIKNRIYSIKKLTLPKWRFKLFLLNEFRKETVTNLCKRREYRKHWFEFTTGWSGFALKYQEAGYNSRAHVQIYLLWGKLFIYTSQKLREYIKGECDHSDEREWGLSYYSEGNVFYINYGRKYKSINMPWSKDWIRTSLLLSDGSWVHETKGNGRDFYDDNIWGDRRFSEIYPYLYKLKSGKIQNVNATVYVYEREWRMKFLKWTKFFNIVDRSIDITFSSEVGERSGSWKGGTTGCGYTILNGETPLMALRRMEKERKF